MRGQPAARAKRKVIAVSEVAATPVSKPSPAAPTGESWGKPHNGQRDSRGRLAQFPSAPAHFRPNLTPHCMLLLGMHGGIYFNPKGGKPGLKYPRSRFPNGIPGVGFDEFPAEWFEGVPKEKYSSRKYSTANNCYRVKSGLDQVGWESSGWINECDPRGWTQWYFRYYMGRRLEGGEDERQIGRWSGVAGEKGRWKNNLIGKCLRDNKAHDDLSVSPVVRQVWANRQRAPASCCSSSTKRISITIEYNAMKRETVTRVRLHCS